MRRRLHGTPDPISRARRNVLRRLVAGAALAIGVPSTSAGAGAASPSASADESAALPAGAYRTVPSSGARIPCMGMGTWLTFDLGTSA